MKVLNFNSIKSIFDITVFLYKISTMNKLKVSEVDEADMLRVCSV